MNGGLLDGHARFLIISLDANVLRHMVMSILKEAPRIFWDV